MTDPHTSVPFLAHVAELRRRLLSAAAAILVATITVFMVGVTPWRSAWRPVFSATDSLAVQAFRALQGHVVPPNVKLVVLHPVDGIMAQLLVGLFLGVVIAVPVWWSRLAGFVTPALLPHERRTVARATVPAVLLFLAGVAFAWWVVLPFLMVTLYGYAANLGAVPYLTVPDLVTFTVSTLLTFGIAFQLPLVMVVLSRVGLVSPAAWWSKWRHATVAAVVVGALVTDPSVVSQIVVAVPLMILYVAGAAWASIGARRQSKP